MSGIYNFIRGISGKLGVGVSDLGFTRSNSLGITNVEGPGVVVRRSLGPTAPGFVKLQQEIVPASWLGTSGISLATGPTLARLAEKG